MRASTLFILIVAILLGFGVAAVVKVSGILRPAAAAASVPEAPAPLPNVLVASRNIFEGNVILGGWVKVRPMTADEAADYKRNKAAYLPPVINAAMERVTACNIEADQPILRQYLRDMAKPDSLHLRLLRSMRAVNVTLPKDSTAGGLIQVGEWVDVYLTSAITGPGASADARVVTNRTANLCCNARVIAKRNTLWPLFGTIPDNALVHFTLEVDPYRAALINYAVDKGVMMLVPLPAAEQRALEIRRNQARGADLGLQEELLTLSGHSQWVRSLAFSADGKRLITVAATPPPVEAQTVAATGRLELKEWDTSDGHVLNALEKADSPMGIMTLESDGRFLAISSDKDVHIYDSAALKEQALLSGLEPVRAIRLSPEGDLLGIGYKDTVKVVDPRTKTDVAVLKDTPALPTLGFSFGRRLIGVGGGTGVDVYDLKTQQIVQKLESGSGAVTHLAFSPDGRWLAAGTKAGAVRIWDVQSGKPFVDLRGHNGLITSLAFSPDGKLLASGSADTTIRVSEIRAGADLAVLHGHSASVRALAFSPDGRRLASSSQDKTCRLWRIATEDSKGADPIVFCAGDGEEYRDEVDRIRAFQHGDLTVGERDLMRVFNLQLPAMPAPNVSVEQFVGLTRRNNLVFGPNDEIIAQPTGQAHHQANGGDHSNSMFTFAIPAGLAHAGDRSNPNRPNQAGTMDPAGRRRNAAGQGAGG